MAETITDQSSKYFQLDGGDTVLQLTAKKWLRWDRWDGVLDTNIPWRESDPRLKEISRSEAIALMK